MKKRVQFICGSIEQTRLMHKIANHLEDCDCRFTPYHDDVVAGWLAQAEIPLITSSAMALREQCLNYLREHELVADCSGNEARYDLVVAPYGMIPDHDLHGASLLLVLDRTATQDLIDSERSSAGYRFGRLQRALRQWLYGNPRRDGEPPYDKLCVPGEACRDLFLRNGADPSRVAVTGMPASDSESARAMADECRKCLASRPVAAPRLPETDRRANLIVLPSAG